MAPTTPDYEYIRALRPQHWSREILTRALGFLNPLELDRLLALAPQHTSWNEFRTSYLTPLIATAPDPTRPYRGIGHTRINYTRPRVNLVVQRALQALGDEDFRGHVRGDEKIGWEQIDHYVWFVYSVVRGNRKRGRIWRNEGRERRSDLARLAFEMLDYLVCEVLYRNQAFRPRGSSIRNERVGEGGGENGGGGGDGGGRGHGSRGGGDGGNGGGGQAGGDGGHGHVRLKSEKSEMSEVKVKLEPGSSKRSMSTFSSSTLSSVRIKRENGAQRPPVPLFGAPAQPIRIKAEP